jgi:hypothetical protein
LVLCLWRLFVQDRKRLVWQDRRPYLGDAAAIAAATEPE